VKRNYALWYTALDKELIDALVDFKAWCFILITFVVVIFIASKAPIAGDFFQLQLKPSLLGLSSISFFAAIISSKVFRLNVSGFTFSIVMLLTSTCFQLFLWLLVCFSELPGATMMAALPILLAAYHGEFFQLSLRFPWGALTTISATLIAFFFSPDAQHHAILGVGGLIALGSAATMGSHAHIKQSAAKQTRSLKAAVDAQILLDSVQEMEQAQSVIYEIRGANHDAGNALSGILMNLELLSSMLSKPNLDKEQLQELRNMSEDLSYSTKHLRELIEQGREAGKKASEQESVNLQTLAQTLITDLENQYPNIVFAVEFSAEVQAKPFIKLHGGELSLHRVLRNLLINASEGNGKEAANIVTLAFFENNDQLEIKVIDNGPGFNNEQINANFNAINSTKVTGTGLGIYTSERIISANLGSISYQNQDDGGAEVCVTLPMPLVH